MTAPRYTAAEMVAMAKRLEYGCDCDSGPRTTDACSRCQRIAQMLRQAASEGQGEPRWAELREALHAKQRELHPDNGAPVTEAVRYEIVGILDALVLMQQLERPQWRCTLCGCLWRECPDSWSLWDTKQQSCKVCDNSPEFLRSIERVTPAQDGLRDWLHKLIAIFADMPKTDYFQGAVDAATRALAATPTEPTPPPFLAGDGTLPPPAPLYSMDAPILSSDAPTMGFTAGGVQSLTLQHAAAIPRCGTCQSFIPAGDSDQIALDVRFKWAWCLGGFGDIPADGSGYCHLHLEAK